MDEINYKLVVKNLMQYQELEITLDETNILHDKTNDDALDDKINSLKLEMTSTEDIIPKDTLERYKKIKNTGILPVTSLEDKKCMGCRLAIPQGEINRMSKAERIPLCPHCGRFIVCETLS